MSRIPLSKKILTLTLWLESNRQCNCNINTYHPAKLQKKRQCTSGTTINRVSFYGDVCLKKSV